MIKDVGIAVDNYKLEKFLETLNKKGYTDITTTKMPKGVTLISIKTDEKNIPDIGDICKSLQFYFKTRTN